MKFAKIGKQNVVEKDRVGRCASSGHISTPLCCSVPLAILPRNPAACTEACESRAAHLRRLDPIVWSFPKISLTPSGSAERHDTDPAGSSLGLGTQRTRH